MPKKVHHSGAGQIGVQISAHTRASWPFNGDKGGRSVFDVNGEAKRGRREYACCREGSVPLNRLYGSVHGSRCSGGSTRCKGWLRCSAHSSALPN
ncbi:hypothetical protein U1Q18_029399 [Sarracenia purpurea var. burkii]